MTFIRFVQVNLRPELLLVIHYISKGHCLYKSGYIQLHRKAAAKSFIFMSTTMAQESYGVDDTLQMVLAEESLSSSDEESDIAEDPDVPLPDVENYSEPEAGMVVDQGQTPESESDSDVGLEMTSDPEMDTETGSNSKQQHSPPEGKTKQK